MISKEEAYVELKKVFNEKPVDWDLFNLFAMIYGDGYLPLSGTWEPYNYNKKR